jgi:interferon gamma-inducible protein 30
MDSIFGDVETVARQCAKNSSMDFEKLQHAYAVQTERIKPTQAFVPYVTLNGNHTDEIQDLAQTNLIALLCDTYKVGLVDYLMFL